MGSRKLNSLLLILLVILDPHPLRSAAACDKQDAKALLAIKQFWGNPDLLSTWDPAKDCCVDWFYVDCGGTVSTLRRVVSIDIRDELVNGTLPPALGNLPYLNYLRLRGHPNLVGPIIPALTRLTRLQTLWLDSNSLSGPIPSFLASMTALQVLDLSGNKLSGSLPPQLPSLPNIRNLILASNQLAGSIPESFANFPSNIVLDLSMNRLSGPVPESMGRLDYGYLSLSGNKLSGDASFLFRPTITPFNRVIFLSNNRFEFDLTNVEFPLNLTMLIIDHNSIFGSIPQQITELRGLDVDVSYNRLCGKIPTGNYLLDPNRTSSFAHNKCLCGSPLPPCKP